MHVQIVNFQLQGLSDADFRRASAELAPAFTSIPGLISKVWLADQETNTYGGVYLWQDRASMESYAASDLFKAITSNPHFVNLSSRNFGTQEAPSRTTGGPLAYAFAEPAAAR